MTHRREQRGVDSYIQGQISRSDCDHGKIYNCNFTRHNMLRWVVLEHFKERQTKFFAFLYLGSSEKIRLLRNWSAMPYDPSGSALLRRIPFKVRAILAKIIY